MGGNNLFKLNKGDVIAMFSPSAPASYTVKKRYNVKKKCIFAFLFHIYLLGTACFAFSKCFAPIWQYPVGFFVK